MTKIIKCLDVRIDCDWKGSAETVDELMKKVREHAKEHGFNESQSAPSRYNVCHKRRIKSISLGFRPVRV